MANKWQRWSGIMKAYPFEEKRLAKWEPPYIVQPKFDGVRCRSIPIQVGSEGNETLLLSSEENIIYGVPHLNIELRGITVELDGELYCHGMNFEGIVSITSRTVNIHPDHKRIQFHIFDVVNEELQMKRQLIIENLRDLNPWLVIAPFWICESLDSVMRAYDTIIEMGYEGIIVRHTQAPYVKKRSIYVMKLKPKKEDIYKIVGFNEEISINGIPKNRLGSLICTGSDRTEFKAGSGFSVDDRIRLWDDKDSLIGKYVRIAYQHMTSGRKVPRFPIFMEVLDYERALERDSKISSL